MQFKTDENLPGEITELLRRHGYDAASAAEQGMAGVEDSAVVTACAAEKRAVVTLDLDFADIRRYPPENSAGIIVAAPSCTKNPDARADDGTSGRAARTGADRRVFVGCGRPSRSDS